MSTNRAPCRVRWGSRAAAPAKPAKPHQQGRLDALCGIYALVNSFAHASRGAPIRYFPSRKLFVHLIERAEFWHGDASFIGEGLAYDAELFLAKAAIRFTKQKDYRFKLVTNKGLSRDYGLGKVTGAAEMTRWFNAFALNPEIAVILDINTPWLSHWSVLAGVEGDRVLLFDSSGMRSVAAAACKPFIAISRLEAD